MISGLKMQKYIPEFFPEGGLGMKMQTGRYFGKVIQRRNEFTEYQDFCQI